MDKYFIPLISDIRIGYECEFTTDGVAFEIECSDDIIRGKLGIIEVVFLIKTLYELGREDELYKHARTPYLTKEAIEAEGWVYSDEQKEYGRLLFRKSIWEILWWGNPDYIEFYRTYQTRTPHEKEWTTRRDCLYKGKCPSINEFRIIFNLVNR